MTIEEPKSVKVDELQLHVDLVVVHLTVEGQLIPSRALEGEVGFPSLAAALGEREGVVVDVD